MSKIDKIGRHIFYKKRNEKPYIVEASATDDAGSGEDDLELPDDPHSVDGIGGGFLDRV